jgi:integrase
MPRKLSNALTPLSVKNAKPGRYTDGGGLQLLVKESGTRSWVYRYTMKGKTRDIGIGPAGPGGYSLATARERRDELRQKVRAGIDPLDEREQVRAAEQEAKQAAKLAGVSFREVAEQHIERNERNWRNDKHRKQWRRTLATYVYPFIGEVPTSDITTEHLLQILEPIWRTKAETASRVRGRIETVLDAAKARGLRHGENPARWRGHLAQILPVRCRLTRGHHRALPYSQLSALVADLQSRNAMAALALEFTILTAGRTEEILGATWQEVDLETGVWIVPAERMKAGKEHRVPLSGRAVDILRHTQLLGTETLFPSASGGRLGARLCAGVKEARSLPERPIFPICGKAHCSEVFGGVGSKMRGKVLHPCRSWGDGSDHMPDHAKSIV